MRSKLARLRAPSQSHNLTSHPPPVSAAHYSLPLATLAAQILFKSPLPSNNDLPVYILNAAAFPDAKSVDYDALLPYVLARLPEEEQLIGGEGYEIVFFAGDAEGPESENQGPRRKPTTGQDSGDGDENVAKASKNSRPGWGWSLQAYQVLSRAMRKRLMRLYVVHEKKWVRVLLEMFATIVSPKVRKKVNHVSTLSALALHIPIEDLLIPPSAYVTDRKKSPDIFAPYASGRRAFGVQNPLPISADGSARLPRILRETTSFLLTDSIMDIDGLFRISARAQSVEILKEAYDRGQKFIVWKWNTLVLTFPQCKEGTGTVTVDELDQIDGYDVHSAAALIKLWYHELREPIFPVSSYQALKKLYADPLPPSPEQLQQLLLPGLEYSPLPRSSGRILMEHLLPLLSLVAEHSDCNRMTPQNLAVVFAPNLICGPDAMEDLKVATIVQRLLVAMITNWKSYLAPAFGRTNETFEESLKLPQVVADREDPLEELRRGMGSSTSWPSTLSGAAQSNGIALIDNDRDIEDSSLEEEDEEDQDGRPPLPPRPCDMPPSGSPNGMVTTSPIRRKPMPSQSDSPQDPLNVATTEATSTEEPPIESNVRRKPAPAVATLPRYSTLITNRPAVLAALEQYDQSTGYDPARVSDIADVPETLATEDLPTYEQSTPIYEGPQPSAARTSTGIDERRRPLTPPEKIPRKPVGEGEGKGGG